VFLETDKIIAQCPYCQHEASIKQFGTWEKDGKRGLLGKTPDGFIMFLCPQCKQHIKYDSLSGKFFKPADQPKSTIIFNLFFFAIIAVVVYFIVRALFR